MQKIKWLSLSVKLLLVTLFINTMVFAQEADKKIDIDISTEPENGFFSQTWVWVVAAAVFILLLVALLRKKN